MLALLMMTIRIDGPVHEIHREMVANAIKQGATRVVVEAAGLQTKAEVAEWLGSGVVVVAKGTVAEGTRYRPTARERIVSGLLDPNVAFLALLMGVLLIYAEFCMPGAVLPGAVGGVVAMTALYGLAASPLRISAIALLLVAALLFGATAFVSWRGTLGLVAAAAMCWGAMLLVDAPSPFRIATPLAVGLTIPFALVTLYLTGFAQRARANKLPEQKAAVVFSYSNDIFSTISGESGKHAKRPRAARRT